MKYKVTIVDLNNIYPRMDSQKQFRQRMLMQADHYLQSYLSHPDGAHAFGDLAQYDFCLAATFKQHVPLEGKELYERN